LLADSDEELDKLAQEDPIMQTAKTTLEAISADPGAQSLAREREMARRAHEHLMYCARVEAKAEGRAEGEARTILAFLEARDIVVTEAQRERILQCTDFERLSTWVRKAVTLSDVNELFAE
jgi:cell fate (sporulation/competence/biofilm development) regulator YlbF (YheA/YmcA/DUF963 family)